MRTLLKRPEAGPDPAPAGTRARAALAEAAMLRLALDPLTRGVAWPARTRDELVERAHQLALETDDLGQLHPRPEDEHSARLRRLVVAGWFRPWSTYHGLASIDWPRVTVGAVPPDDAFEQARQANAGLRTQPPPRTDPGARWAQARAGAVDDLAAAVTLLGRLPHDPAEVLEAVRAVVALTTEAGLHLDVPSHGSPARWRWRTAGHLVDEAAVTLHGALGRAERLAEGRARGGDVAAFHEAINEIAGDLHRAAGLVARS